MAKLLWCPLSLTSSLNLSQSLIYIQLVIHTLAYIHKSTRYLLRLKLLFHHIHFFLDPKISSFFSLTLPSESFRTLVGFHTKSHFNQTGQSPETFCRQYTFQTHQRFGILFHSLARSSYRNKQANQRKKKETKDRKNM